VHTLVYYYKLGHDHFFRMLFKLLITNYPSPEYMLKYIDTAVKLTINLEVKC